MASHAARKTMALLEILLANLFWGFGFVATIWALRDLAPAAIVAYRFLIAGGAGLLIYILGTSFSRTKMHANNLASVNAIGKAMRVSFVPGFYLGLTLILQTWGLLTTTAGKSGFITVMYVVFVPIFEIALYNTKFKRSHGVAVALALIGIALMTQLRFSDFIHGKFVVGDLLTLGCAITAALHIIFVGKISQGKLADSTASLFLANAGQSLWAGVFSLMLIPFGGNWKLTSLTSLGIWGLIFLTFGSSLLGFFLQFRAQRSIDSAKAAVLYLLESPFSAFFGFIFLNELLSLPQLLGAAFILAGCVIAIQGDQLLRTIFKRTARP